MRVPVQLAAPLALAALPSAQLPTALAAVGEHLPGTPAEHSVVNVGSVATNAVGGFALVAWTNNAEGSDARSWLWGSLDSSAAGVLRPLQTLGALEQIAFGTYHDLNDAGQLIYRAAVLDADQGGAELDSLWLDDTLLWKQGDAVPGQAGASWTLFARPVLQSDGSAWWISNGTSLFGLQRALYRGSNATPVYQAGDLVPPLTVPLDADAMDWAYAVAPNGAHHIAILRLDAGVDEDQFVALDGQILQVGGQPIGEGELLGAPLSGGPGERWRKTTSFSNILGEFNPTTGQIDVNAAGDYVFAGTTTAPAPQDVVVIKNGALLFREGQSTISGEINPWSSHWRLTEAGDVVHTSKLVLDGVIEDALWWNDVVLLVEGDSIDLDGDGALDPHTKLERIVGEELGLAQGADCAIYVQAQVDVLGTPQLWFDDIEVLLRVELPQLVGGPDTLSLSAGGQLRFDLCAGVAHAGEPYFVLGSTAGTTPGLPLGVDTLPLNPSAYLNLSLGAPNQPPLVDTLAALDSYGRAQAGLALPSGSDPVLAGLTLHHAYLQLDASFAITGASNALQAQLVP